MNQLAKYLVDKTTGQLPPAEPVNPISAAASALGKLGGAKGGKARAAALTKEQRSAIAKKAAAKRWEANRS